MNYQKNLIKQIARSVCKITGSSKPYRRIMRFCGSKRSIEKPLEVNCHGFTLFALGVDPSPYPRDIDAEIIGDFLWDSCNESSVDNGIILILRAGDKQLEHSALYIPSSDGILLVHKEEIGHEYGATPLQKFFEEDPCLEKDTRPEYYALLSNEIKIPSYFLNR